MNERGRKLRKKVKFLSTKKLIWNQSHPRLA